jgi:hypothetical protein
VAAPGTLSALFRDADGPSPADDEIAWYEARLPRDAGSLLAPMCGAGSRLVPLVGAGFNVHGVDASAASLALCERRLSARGDEARLFRQDVVELNLPFRYAAAFVAAGAFQRIVDPRRAQIALARLRSHLVDPGVLILDLSVPAESAQRIAAPLVEIRSVALADGTRIGLRSETTMQPDARLARTASRYVHRRGNDLLAEESEIETVTWYAPDDIASLVSSAGYGSVEMWASPRAPTDGTAFALLARA